MGLYKREGSQFYWMTFRVNGRKVSESTKTKNKKLAEKIYAKRITEITEGRWFEGQIKKRTLNEMVEKFQRENTDHKSYYNKARDMSIFKNLYKFFVRDTPSKNGKTIEDLSLEELQDLAMGITLQDVEDSIGEYEQWRKSKSRKPATIVKELGLLRRMFNIARKQWKWKMNNPIAEIELPKVRNERVRYLSQDEYKKLFVSLDSLDEKWLKPVVIIALETGLRLSNLCNLIWSEINLFGHMITIDAEKMKNDDYIGIPLTERAYQTLREQQRVRSLTSPDYVFHDDGEALYDRKVQRAFNKALSAAQISNFHFHDLRHTFASYLRQRHIDLHTISKLLGHRDTRMTQRYSHLSIENLKDAISVLNAMDGYILATVENGNRTQCHVTH